ncbi:MAG: TetR/AcrR family transcriptional regulator [Thermoleophilia bacterium]
MPATKEEIAATFDRLALRYKYRRASVDDVARELHISKQTIYEHFQTKQDLYRSSVELWAREQRAHVEALLTETTALGRIAQVVEIAFADARRSFDANPSADASEPGEIVDEVNARVFGPMVRDLIVQRNEAGEFQVEDPGTTAAFTVAVGTEAVRMMRDDRSGRAEEAAYDAIRRLISDAGGAGRGPSGGADWVKER